MSRSVIRGVVVRDAQTQFIRCRLRDRQLTGQIRRLADRIVRRNTGCYRRVLFRGHIRADRRRGAKSGKNLGTIIRQFAGDRKLTRQRRAAIVNSRLVGGLDRQLNDIIESDFISVDRNGDGLGRVSADLQRIGAECFEECGRCIRRILGPDRLVFCHIVCDLGCGALQVVVHGDRSLIQLEVRIVGVRLIDVVRVLAGNKRGLVTNMHCTIIASPIVDNIRAGAGSSRRAGSRSGRSLDRLGRGIDSTLAGAVGSDRVVDGYLVLFPHGEEIIIRLVFVGRNLRCSVTVSIRVGRTGPDEEVSGRAALGLGPALEGIAFTGLRTKDINGLVDLELLVGTIQRALAAVIAAVVAVPVDVGRSVLLDLDVLRTQLDRIGRHTDLGMGRVLCRTGVSGVVRVDPLGNNDLGVILQHVKRSAGIHVDVSILVFARCFVPLLDDPVIKTILCAVFSLGCGDGRGRGMILVLMGIRTCGAFYSFPLVVKAVSGINKTDTLGAFQYLAPLGV